MVFMSDQFNSLVASSGSRLPWLLIVATFLHGEFGFLLFDNLDLNLNFGFIGLTMY